jgi:hypothetical protein
MLASSYGNQEILQFAATKPEGQALMVLPLILHITKHLFETF